MKNLFPAIISTLFLAVRVGGSENPKTFTHEEILEFHQSFQYPLHTWFNKGDLSRYVYLNMERFWFHETISNGTGTVKQLPKAASNKLASFELSNDGGKKTLIDHISERSTNSFIVLHEGKIVFEAYPKMASHERHAWFSVSKTMDALAVAILQERGKISVDQPIDSYIPEFRGTAWEGIPVIDILDMTSGIDCPDSFEHGSQFLDIYNKIGFPEYQKSEPRPIEAFRSLKKRIPPGHEYEYQSLNSQVLGWLVERVAGEPYQAFIEREVWQKIGAESDSLILSSPYGGVVNGGFMRSRLRDLARYGMIFTYSNSNSSEAIISNEFLKTLQVNRRPDLNFEKNWVLQKVGREVFSHSSYQWDLITKNGDLYKNGADGQGLYVSPSKNLVFAWFGSETPDNYNEMLWVVRQIIESKTFEIE